MNIVVGGFNCEKILIIILICLMFNAIDAFAGDIPESLMLGNQQALFIGKLSGQDSSTYTIIPLTVMMGSVPQDVIKINKFEKYYGTKDSPKIGDFLVVVLLEGNKIDDSWIFKSTTDDYKTLKLISEKYDIVERYQKYINEGRYFEAQKRIDEKAKNQINTTELAEITEASSNKLSLALYLVIFLSLLSCGFYWCISKKQK